MLRLGGQGGHAGFMDLGSKDLIRGASGCRRAVSGMAVSRWNFTARFRAILPVLASVLIQAIKNIPTLAMVLEIRGVGKAKPTVFRPIQCETPLYKQFLLYFLPITVIILILVIYAA